MDVGVKKEIIYILYRSDGASCPNLSPFLPNKIPVEEESMRTW